MQIWTHRGNPGPENTIEGFSKAWLDGIRFFETDLHCTSDGVLVLAHDSDISRLTGVQRKIRDLTWNELRKYKIQGQFNWTTLDELHNQFKPDRISLDIKSKEAVKPFLDWAGGKDLEHYVVGSFSAKRVVQVRNAYPQLKTALTPKEVLLIATGLGHLLPEHRAERVAMVPPRFNGFKILNQSFISFCSKNKIEINVWTINSQEEFDLIRHLGINGIITDKYHQFI